MKGQRSWLALLGLVLIAACFLSRLGTHPLIDPDEGRYAEIPREMIESGDWITPRLNYVTYYEKPPLFYWLVGASFEAFGATEAAARLVPALAGVLTVVLTFLLGRAALGERAAWIAAGTLASSPLFFGVSQTVVIDMLLTACTTGTLVCAWEAHRRERKAPWVLGVAATAALAVLAKGLIGVALPGIVVLAYIGLRRDGATFRGLLGWRPVVAFAAIALPWFVLVGRAHPEFLHYLIVEEHFSRFLGEVGHPEGPFYYVQALLLGSFPWSLFALALGFTRPGRVAFARIPREFRAFLLCWAGLVVGFFTLASSKLPTYVLPAFPAFALLFGGWASALVELEAAPLERALRLSGRVCGWLGAFLAAASAVAWIAASSLAPGFGVSLPVFTSVSAAVLGLGAVLFATSAGMRRWRGQPAAVGLLAILIVGWLGASYAGIGGRAAAATTREMGLAVREHRGAGDLVASYQKLMQGLSFYSEGRVVMVEGAGEIWPGSQHAPDADDWFWTSRDQLVAAWNSPRRVFLAILWRDISELEADLVPEPRLLAIDFPRALVVNFPAPGSRPVSEVRRERQAARFWTKPNR